VINLKLLLPTLRSILGQLPHLGKAIHLVWTAAHNWMLVWISLLIVQGLLPGATVYLSRSLVNRLVRSVGGGTTWEAVRPVLGLVAWMAGLMLLTELLRGAATWVRTAQSELVKDYISRLIQHQSSTVDFAFYESPDYYDRLHRAQRDAYFRPVALLESGGSVLQNSITLLAMVAVLIPFGLWLPLALLVSTLPAFHVVLRFSLRQYQLGVRMTPDERRAWYYNWLLTTGDTAAEMRLFNLGNHFQELHQAIRERLRNEQLRLVRQQGLSEVGAGGMALLITGITLAWMVWRALQGRVTLGDLALFYQAFNQGQGVMRSVLQNLGQIYSNSLFLSNLFEFLDLQPQVIDPQHPLPIPTVLQQGIRFEHIKFSYPGSDRVALENFNLTIPAGQIVAIVGNNGAGKSTLIKLLCRLYDPQAGRITLDGLDLKDLATADLRNLITVLFQQPVHYNATAAENIALGVIGRDAENGGAADQIDRAIESRIQHLNPQIVAAAEAGGADQPINRLPQTYDTLLGKWFVGGTDLSGGEWQRVALSRAFLRQAEIIILDEPTSAMDSWAEADWLRRFRSLVAGRTAIIITHRFTTAMQADMIHVMVEGKIVESGRHAGLLAQGGSYAQSWALQVQGITP